MVLSSAWASKSPSADKAAIRKSVEQCRLIKKYVVKSSYKVDCYNNYHHYNSSRYKTSYKKTSVRKKGTVKIASYNMLHPGSQRSMFKDLKLMAKVMNNWDIVVGLELLPIAGRDLENNNRVLKALKTSKSKKIEALFRGPGYLNILNELRKLDKSWALILSPRGDAAKKGQVEEHVGFFYRATRAKPILNEHCQEYKKKGDGTALACFPNFRKAFMGRETTNVFSRRPFIASFESGSFDFTLVGSHVIFGSPTSKTDMRRILQPSFGVSTYSGLGTGMSSVTYARFAETAVTLEMMDNLRHYYSEQDVILAADFNLSHTNKFWGEVLSLFKGGRLYQKQATTVTHQRNSDGLSSSYDHFIIDPSETDECKTSSGKMRVTRFNTYKGTVGSYITKNYIIRKSGSMTQTSAGKAKRKKRLDEFKKYLKSIYTFKNGKIQWDDYQFDERVKAYDTRLFASQLKSSTYHKVQQELLSDHMPITLSCSTK